MKALGICGSPRKSGNSDLLLDRSLELSEKKDFKTQKIYICDYDISPCQECGGCNETGFCIVEDDMQRIYEKISGADRIIISTPIFFTSLPAQVKAFIDRFQCFWMAKYELKKPRIKKEENKEGALITVGGQNEQKHFGCAELIIKAFYATANIKYDGGFYFPLADSKGDVLKNNQLVKEFDDWIKGTGLY